MRRLFFTGQLTVMDKAVVKADFKGRELFRRPLRGSRGSYNLCRYRDMELCSSMKRDHRCRLCLSVKPRLKLIHERHRLQVSLLHSRLHPASPGFEALPPPSLYYCTVIVQVAIEFFCPDVCPSKLLISFTTSNPSTDDQQKDNQMLLKETERNECMKPLYR